MRIICSQKRLAHILETMSSLLKQEISPIFHSILLSTHHTAPQESVTLIGSGMYGIVGMLCSLPATVEEDGQVLVPIEPFAEYIRTLRTGPLTLSQKEQPPPSPARPLDAALKPEEASPLKVESHFTSQAGTCSTNTAHLKSWITTAYPLPKITQWLEESVTIATFPSSTLRTAIARSVLTEKQNRQQKQEATPMDGILFHVNEQEVALIVATKTHLVSHRISLTYTSPVSCSLLFDGKALNWIKKVLTEDGEVTLSLARDGTQHILLLTMNNRIAFCRSTEKTPIVWEPTLLSPHEIEFTVARKDFSRALAPFAAFPLEKYQVLEIVFDETTLSMRIVPDADIAMYQSQILQNISPPHRGTILVDPKQLKQLVNATTAPLLHVQIGTFERLQKQELKRIDFLRIQAEQSTMIMTLSRLAQKHQPEAVSSSLTKQTEHAPSPV